MTLQLIDSTSLLYTRYGKGQALSRKEYLEGVDTKYRA